MGEGAKGTKVVYGEREKDDALQQELGNVCGRVVALLLAEFALSSQLVPDALQVGPFKCFWCGGGPASRDRAEEGLGL